MGIWKYDLKSWKMPALSAGGLPAVDALLDAHCAVPELPFRKDKRDSWISFPRKCKNGIFTEIVTKELTDPFV